MTVRDLSGPGTRESTWQGAGCPDAFRPLAWSQLVAGRRVVVIAPHPDDEVLGVGGVLARLGAEGFPTTVVAVTDGERSHPGRAHELPELRAAERGAALHALGATADVVRLGLPDSAVHAGALRERLEDLLRPDDVVLAPWESDGHPDHDACGTAVRGLGRARWSYLVWTWHWATPADLPVDRARRVTMSGQQLSAKRRAVAAYSSQLEGPDPILPPHVRVRLLRQSETLLEEAS